MEEKKEQVVLIKKCGLIAEGGLEMHYCACGEVLVSEVGRPDEFIQVKVDPNLSVEEYKKKLRKKRISYISLLYAPNFKKE